MIKLLNKLILSLSINKFFALNIFKNYLSISMSKIYISPSKLQAIKFKKNILNNWKQLEFSLIKKIVLETNKKPLIYDIGSNVGVSILGYTKNLEELKGKDFDYKCVGFEPFKLNWKYFNHNTKGFKQISLIKTALSNDNRTIEFSIPSYVEKLNKDLNNTGFISGKKELFNSKKIKYSFETKKLDDFLNLISENESLIFIKIDVEGFEQKVLEGASKHLEIYKPILVVEKNVNTSTKDEFLEILKLVYKKNYKTFFPGDFSNDKNGYVWMVHEEKKKLVKLINSYFKEFKLNSSVKSV